MDPRFPLNLWDISLLLAVAATVLLVTSELLSPYYGKTSIRINKEKLKNAALTTSTLFLLTVAIRIASIILNF
jgi:hypothetical protein